MASSALQLLRSISLALLLTVTTVLPIHAALVSVPLSVDPVLQSRINTICGANWQPYLLTSHSIPLVGVGTVSQSQTWIGQCTQSGYVGQVRNPFPVITVSADGTEAYYSINATDAVTGSPSSWILTTDSSGNSPALIPIGGNFDYGKLMLTASGSTWISYRNTSSAYQCPNDRLIMGVYSMPTDTFFAMTETCPGQYHSYGYKPAFLMRKNGVDQSIENYCPPTYLCSFTLSLFNDGTTDHLYRTTWAAADESGRDVPMVIYRQSLVNGGPQTANSIVAVGPSNSTQSCNRLGSSGPVLVVHPQGKMVFGGCELGGGLFYADMRDPNPSTPPSVQFVSTCKIASSDQIQVTNDRLYALCDRTNGYYDFNLRVYALTVAADGTVTFNETNYLDFNSPDCVVYDFSVMPSPIAGRPDAVWFACATGLYSNVCGFGKTSSVSTAGDTYNCTACPKNSLQLSSTASFITDTVCTPCPSGTYVASATATSCTSCEAGKFLATPSNSSCTICPAGTYQNMTAATSCVVCPKPYIISSAGSTTVANCTQEICEIPGSNPLYCKSVTTSSAPLAQPSTWAFMAITMLAFVVFGF